MPDSCTPDEVVSGYVPVPPFHVIEGTVTPPAPEVASAAVMPPLTAAELGIIFDVCGNAEVLRVGRYLTARLSVCIAIPAYLEAFHAMFGGKVSGTYWRVTNYEDAMRAADTLLPHVRAQRALLLVWRDMRATIRRDGPMPMGAEELERRDVRLGLLRQLRKERKSCHLEAIQSGAIVPLRHLAADAARAEAFVLRNREERDIAARRRTDPSFTAPVAVIDHLGQVIWRAESGEPLPDGLR